MIKTILKGIGFSAAALVLILFVLGLYSYNGHCGIDLGLLGGNSRECTFVEYISSKDGIVLVAGLILSNLWYLALVAMLLSVLGFYFWEGKKRKI